MEETQFDASFEIVVFTDNRITVKQRHRFWHDISTLYSL